MLPLLKARSQKLQKRSIEFIPQAREATLPSYDLACQIIHPQVSYDLAT